MIMSQILSKYIQRLLSLLCLTFVLFSCSNEDDSISEVQEEEHTVQMLFLAAPPTYYDADDGSEAKTTRAATADWPDGARLYLRFNNNGATGTATYNAATKQWTLAFKGNLNENLDDTCAVWYFENNTIVSNIKPTAAIYHTTSATYLFHNDVVHLRANLKPTEARIRFHGTPGTKIDIINWPHYSSFNLSTTTLVEVNERSVYTLTVGSDGYTPYIYGHNNTTINGVLLNVEIDKTPFSRKLTSSQFLLGRSYSTTVPTESQVAAGIWSHNVSLYRTFTLSNNGKTVSFNMIWIKEGSFQMGSTTGYSDELPVHGVTITKDYYIAQTEVTQALWYAVMGQSPTSNGSKWSSEYGLGNEHPAYFISHEDCQSFILALNSKLSSQLKSGETFRFPTEAEWNFAAKGGNKSKGYTYAGSNLISDVAWYKVNSYDIGSSNANYGTHAVKTKLANELGLYDMSGNVWEWCYDWVADYRSNWQTDPIGPTSGYSHITRGGGWFADAVDNRVDNRCWSEPSYRASDLGLRLCLGAPIGQ